MKIITEKDLVGPVKQRIGISGYKRGRGTDPWVRLQEVGLSKVDAEHKPVKHIGEIVDGYEGVTVEMFAFTGHVEFLIRQGGVNDDMVSAKCKEIFREDVYPAIKNFVPECGIVFRLILHYNQRLLMKVELWQLKATSKKKLASEPKIVV